MVKDITGEKFGRLLVIEPFFVLNAEENKLAKMKKWKCLCDCGNEVITRHIYLKSGDVKSCGCLYKDSRKELSKRITKRNLKEYGLDSFNGLYNSYKQNAISKNRKFELTKEQFRQLTKQNCFYCDLEPKQIRKNYKRNSNG